jgi:hypothetical protein
MPLPFTERRGGFSLFVLACPPDRAARLGGKSFGSTLGRFLSACRMLEIELRKLDIRRGKRRAVPK